MILACELPQLLAVSLKGALHFKVPVAHRVLSFCCDRVTIWTNTRMDTRD
jgi:hypothetical protein